MNSTRNVCTAQGKIGERMIIRSSTVTGDGLRSTVTRQSSAEGFTSVIEKDKEIDLVKNEDKKNNRVTLKDRTRRMQSKYSDSRKIVENASFHLKMIDDKCKENRTHFAEKFRGMRDNEKLGNIIHECSSRCAVSNSPIRKEISAFLNSKNLVNEINEAAIQYKKFAKNEIEGKTEAGNNKRFGSVEAVRTDRQTNKADYKDERSRLRLLESKNDFYRCEILKNMKMACDSTNRSYPCLNDLDVITDQSITSVEDSPPMAIVGPHRISVTVDSASDLLNAHQYQSSGASKWSKMRHDYPMHSQISQPSDSLISSPSVFTAPNNDRNVIVYGNTKLGVNCSTPKKVLVNPQPNNFHREERDSLKNNVSEHHYSGSHGMLSALHDTSMDYIHDRYEKDQENTRIVTLEHRVHELEQILLNKMQASSTGTPVGSKVGARMMRSASGPFIPETQYQQRDGISEWDAQTRRLQAQLSESYSRLEISQAEYRDETYKIRARAAEVDLQLHKFKSKLHDIETECKIYREKSICADAERRKAIETFSEKFAKQEEELILLRRNVKEFNAKKNDFKNAREQLERLKKENEDLNSLLFVKDTEINLLKSSSAENENSIKVLQEAVEELKSRNSLLKSVFDAQTLVNEDIKENASQCFLERDSIKTSKTTRPEDKSIQLPRTLSSLIRKQFKFVIHSVLDVEYLQTLLTKALNDNLSDENNFIQEIYGSEVAPRLDLPTSANLTSPMSISRAEDYLKRMVEGTEHIAIGLPEIHQQFIELFKMNRSSH